MSFDDLNSLYENCKENIEQKINVCNHCSIPMDIVDNLYICKNCGFMIEITVSERVFKNSNQSFTVKGNCGQANTLKKLNRILSEPSQESQKNNILKSIVKFNQNSGELKLSKDTINQVVDLYYESTNPIIDNKTVHFTYRSQSKNGGIAACIYVVTCNNEIPIETKKIMKFCELTNSNKFNKGMENLMRFVKIEKKDPIPNHIKENLEKLEITLDYSKVIEEIYYTVLNRITEFKGIYSSTNISRCIGIIYLIIKQCDIGITEKTIAAKCEISKTTFERFYLYLVNNKEIINVILKANNIPEIL
jgi:transcription initiation factor TFIIIB Brf1 subunit/transcription initiation factor TFIIB